METPYLTHLLTIYTGISIAIFAPGGWQIISRYPPLSDVRHFPRMISIQYSHTQEACYFRTFRGRRMGRTARNFRQHIDHLSGRGRASIILPVG